MTERYTYTKEEEEFIAKNYPTMGWDELLEGISKVSGYQRSKTSLICKASAMGVKRSNVSYSSYTPEEDMLIKEVYNISDEHELEPNICKLIDEKMPYRTLKSIQTRASRLGLRVRKAWADEEKSFIIDNYYNMTTEEVANHLGRTSNGVYLMIKKMGLSGAPTYKYSQEDIDFVANNYKTMSDQELGKALHRAGQSIKEMRRAHHLYRKDPNDVTHYRYITNFINRHNSDWKKRSAEACGYKCVLTNGKFDDIHHLYSKNMIIDAVLSRMGIPNDFDINNCDEKIKEDIIREFHIEQDKYPLGVCLNKDVHHSFHVLYGFGDNTPEQFYEYAKKFPQNSLCINQG